MKTIVILSMLGISSFAYSEVVPTNKLSEVIQAIKDSISTKDLDCVESVQGINFKASTLNWYVVSSGELKINENQQPVIVLHQNAGDTLFDTTVEVTTNSDYTVVEEIEATQYQPSTTTSTRKNVGTIINPRYETVTVTTKGKLFQKVECK